MDQVNENKLNSLSLGVGQSIVVTRLWDCENFILENRGDDYEKPYLLTHTILGVVARFKSISEVKIPHRP